MSALVAWGQASLVASAGLLLLVLLVRSPARRLFGPRLAYALWALPALRLVLPPLPGDLFAAMPLAGSAANPGQILSTGPQAAAEPWSGLATPSLGEVVMVVWLVGAVGFFTFYAARHFAFCRALAANCADAGRIGAVRVVAADVEGPLAFGVFRRFIAVPRAFAHAYSATERDLALAHEHAHHARGDLIANWASLVVLAAHWWNPIAWAAIRAFRDDQEFATDAHVLAAKGPGALAHYAQVLAKAAGVGALPACNLNARSNLKGRLMILGQTERSRTRRFAGGIALILIGGTALATTATALDATGPGTGKQAVTIGVKPGGEAGYALVIGSTVVAPGAPLPGGATLPADFDRAGGCDMKPTAKPHAMVIKGMDGTQTYTIMCASAAPAPVRATLVEGLSSLKTMRRSVATQPASATFPETERTRALGAIDRSIREVEATLASIN